MKSVLFLTQGMLSFRHNFELNSKLTLLNKDEVEKKGEEEEGEEEEEREEEEGVEEEGRRRRRKGRRKRRKGRRKSRKGRWRRVGRGEIEEEE